MSDNLRGVPVDELEEVIENAAGLSKSLADTANEAVAALWMLKGKVLGIENELKKYRAEIARLEIEIGQRRDEHHQLETSLAGLREYVAQHRKNKSHYVERLDELIVSARQDREDLQRRIKRTLARAA